MHDPLLGYKYDQFGNCSLFSIAQYQNKLLL